MEYEIIESIKNDYKISVIIPTYNTGNILHRTMNSIENQTFGFENIEVVIVDDCSNSETIKIINQYSSFENVKVIYLNSNTGASGTPRNISIKEASSDYVMFLDHDDFFKHDALEELYNKIMEYNCDLVFGTYNSISNGKLFDIKYPNEKNGYFNSISDNERLIAFPPPSIWTKLFRKSVIIENNILFPPILGEDAIFMFKFLLNSKGIYYLWNSLICFHDLNKDSTTNNVSFNYLMEGLTAEKYLFNISNSINKDYYFKYRLEGNLDFFLSQFFKSNLNEKEVNDILPLLYWFAEKGTFYNLTPIVDNLDYFSIMYDLEIYYLKKMISWKDSLVSDIGEKDKLIEVLGSEKDSLVSDIGEKDNIIKELLNEKIKLNNKVNKFEERINYLAHENKELNILKKNNESIIKNLRDENFILSTTIKKYESYNTFKFNKYLNDILNRNK